MLVVAILETMWGAPAPGEDSQRYFRINPANHSGKRLYRIVGKEAKLLVTNACREYVTKATQHGKPDPAWLSENLRLIDADNGRISVILACGKVAQKTLALSGFQPQNARVIEMPHPAARFLWTTERESEIRTQVNAEKDKADAAYNWGAHGVYG